MPEQTYYRDVNFHYEFKTKELIVEFKDGKRMTVPNVVLDILKIQEIGVRKLGPGGVISATPGPVDITINMHVPKELRIQCGRGGE